MHQEKLYLKSTSLLETYVSSIKPHIVLTMLLCKLAICIRTRDWRHTLYYTTRFQRLGQIIHTSKTVSPLSACLTWAVQFSPKTTSDTLRMPSQRARKPPYPKVTFAPPSRNRTTFEFLNYIVLIKINTIFTQS